MKKLFLTVVTFLVLFLLMIAGLYYWTKKVEVSSEPFGLLQNSGPVQNAGPLQNAAPMQNTGPYQPAPPVQYAAPFPEALGALEFSTGPDRPGWPTEYGWTDMEEFYRRLSKFLVSHPSSSDLSTVVSSIPPRSDNPREAPPVVPPTNLPPVFYPPGNSFQSPN